MVVWIYGVYSLSNSEHHEEYGGHQGQNGPWASEVGVDQVGPPLVPPLPAVPIHLLMHLLQSAVWV
ncbi:hypothetical protein Scep_021755 [Stephania cephalantha]|uniref:Uncharacterized protein n=1 Tax=Stephania cephalantha TaxID=152367 RepID=A0AAP0I1M8_9MAGN